MNAAAQRPTISLPSNGILTVDLGALRHNYQYLKRLAPSSDVAAVVKANAYGLGADRAAPVLYNAGCRIFFVALFNEAVSLRAILPSDAAIYVLNGLLPGQETAAVELDILPVLNSLAQIARWREVAGGLHKTLTAAVQVDSGMSRLGLSPEELAELHADPDCLSGIEVTFVMSHLACADEPDHVQNKSQLNAFVQSAKLFGNAKHCFSNSGGLFLGEDFHKALIRPGIALYGVSPIRSLASELRAVVRLEAAVIQTRLVKKGAAIGYGASLTAPHDMRLATIAAGYADGLPRALSNRGAAYFNGKRLPFAGRVSMDSIILDISALADGEIALGDMVELIGDNQSLDDLADAADTIAYEILTGLGQRYGRQYLGNETIEPAFHKDALQDAMPITSASACL